MLELPVSGSATTAGYILFPPAPPETPEAETRPSAHRTLSAAVAAARALDVPDGAIIEYRAGPVLRWQWHAGLDVWLGPQQETQP